jgi:4'-phosphopantetheinyl transferase
LILQLPPRGTVHVWRFPLSADAAHITRMTQVLSRDERARAGRLRFDRDRDRFVISRAVYRDVLGRYAGMPPEAVPLTAVPGEKPRSTALAFAHNLSHAHNVGVVGVAAEGDLGIDVDYLDREIDLGAVAPMALCGRELAAWNTLPPDERRSLFFSIWTRKEAILKATGDRHAFDFRDLDLAAITLPGSWSIASCSPERGYLAAIALRSAVMAHGSLLSVVTREV